MHTKIIFFVIFLFCSNLLFSQEDPISKPNNKTGLNINLTVPEEIHTKCKNFFDKIVANDIDDGYKKLLVNSALLKKKEDVSNLITQTKRAKDIYGVVSSFDMVSYEFASTSFLRVRYIGNYSEMPLRWIITFYKSPKYGWIVTDLKLDDLAQFFFSDE